MEQRKLIRLGNSSFAIALPKPWVSKSNLKKGDKIFVEENGNGEIIVSSEFKKTYDVKEQLLNIEGKEDDEIARDLISAYISGNKVINVTGEKEKIKLAKEKAKNFLNLEVIEEDKTKVVFKDLLDIEDISIEKFIRRMDNNIKDMFLILQSLTNDTKKIKEKIKELENIDKDITKFYFLIWRLMNIGINNPSFQTDMKIDPKSFVTLFWISYNIEQVGDELKRIARKLEKSNGEKSNLKEILLLTAENYDKSMEAFFEKNKEIAREVVLKKDISMKMCEKLSDVAGFEAIAEKFQQINANIHNNSKMIFYEI